jgi:VWFA-related protein
MSTLRSPFVAFVGTALIGAIVAAQSQQSPPAPTDPNRQVFRLGVELVQIDATVTDKRGRHVSDLTAEDFEVFQDGRPQRITTFAYVRGPAPATTAVPAGAPLGPSRPLTADRVRRTIAIVVDDLGLSFESTARIRDVLRGFLDKQMQQGDLVAIIRTGAGSGALQQFTSDRRVLNAAVDRVRWNMMARGAAFPAESEADRQVEGFRNEIFCAGTLGAITYVVRGIAELPGRKSVIVLSDGFRLTDADGYYGRVMDSMRTLVDAANRAGVVIYSIDARGLVVTGPSAADISPDASAGRAEELNATQDGLGFLAYETGGLFVRNQNDIGGAVERALEDQQGYYLLGYVPDGSTFDATRPRFHKLSVRAKQPDLRVRSRKGFFGRSDPAPKSITAASRIVAAVMSPFAGGDVGLRLSSFFGHVEKTGPVILSVMHINARDLAFLSEADGTRVAEVEVLAVTFGEDGQIADQNGRRFTFRLAPDAYARALSTGFVYRIRVPLKKAGPYQLRIAVRDTTSDKIGSASQFIDAPDVKKGRLALSGLVIEGLSQPSQTAADNVVDHSDPSATVALRTFRQGIDTRYFSEIYNARRRNGLLDLESETRLYRDGVEVFRGTPRPVVPQADSRAPLVAGGILQIGGAMPAGSYVFELLVTDKVAKRRASQTIDFDVVQR